MECPVCGMTIEESCVVCPGCGTALTGTVRRHYDLDFTEAEQNLAEDFRQIKKNYADSKGIPRGPRLNTERSLLLFVLLSLITLGLYGMWFIYQMSEDVNLACEGDGSYTSGFVPFLILSYVTLFIYVFFWCYKLGNRLHDNASRYGLQFKDTGSSILLWGTAGILLLLIGPFVAMYKLIRNTNQLCKAYNKVNGYPDKRPNRSGRR